MNNFLVMKRAVPPIQVVQLKRGGTLRTSRKGWVKSERLSEYSYTTQKGGI